MSEHQPAVEGHCDPRFTAVRTALEENFRDRGELGAAVTVTVGGETVADLWGGGWADAAGTRPWERDTLVNVGRRRRARWPCAPTSSPTGACSTWTPRWPRTGRSSPPPARRTSSYATFSPTAPASPACASPHSLAQLYDWELTTERLAATEPWWEPGTRSGYHALTYGFLVGEVVRRVSGLLPSAFLEREVTGPLGIDFTIGLPEKEAGRAAELVHPPAASASEQAAVFSQLAPAAIAALTNPVAGAAEANTPEWRAAEIPAANGHGTARAVAALYGVFAGRGAYEGHRILSPRRPSGCARGRAVAATWCSAPVSRTRRRSGSACGSAARTDRTARTRRLSDTTASAAPSVSPTPRRGCRSAM